MPQLDNYIISQIIVNSNILWIILLLININLILINLYLSLIIKFVHFFIIKFFINSFFKEILLKKKIKYIKKIYKILLNWLLFFNKIIFEHDLLRIKNINNLILKKLNLMKKNNIWIFINIELKRNPLFIKWH